MKDKNTGDKNLTGNSFVITCKTCPNQTCHPNCGVADKTHCGVMRNGKCTVCGCPDWNHENRNYVWEAELKTVEIKPSVNEYGDAKRKKTRAQQLLDNCDERLRELQKSIQDKQGNQAKIQ